MLEGVTPCQFKFKYFWKKKHRNHNKTLAFTKATSKLRTTNLLYTSCFLLVVVSLVLVHTVLNIYPFECACYKCFWRRDEGFFKQSHFHRITLQQNIGINKNDLTMLQNFSILLRNFEQSSIANLIMFSSFLSRLDFMFLPWFLW